MMPAVKAAIALGSNLDGPEARVRRAFAQLATLPRTMVAARSALYRTAPVGYADQPAFVNACALVETRLQAIVRRGRSGVTAEWDGGLVIAAVHSPR